MILVGVLLVIIVFQLHSIENLLKESKRDPGLQAQHDLKIYIELWPHIGKEVSMEVDDSFSFEFDVNFDNIMVGTLLRLDKSYAMLSSRVKKDSESQVLIKLSCIRSLNKIKDVSLSK